MRKKILFAILAIAVLSVGMLVISTVSAQRRVPKQEEIKAPKPTGGYLPSGKYINGDAKPVDYTWCYPGTWVANPNYTNPQLYGCRGGSVYGTGQLAGPGAPD